MHTLHTSNAAHAASVVVEKTDDLISALTLVRATFAAGNVAANAPAVTDREPTTDELAAPGLLQTINAYLEGKEAFCRGSVEEQDGDAFVSSTYGDAYGRLKSWKRGAVTRHEALAALRLADDELANGDDELGLAMVRAARQFLDPTSDKQAAPALPWGRSDKVYREDLFEIDDAITQVHGLLGLALHSLSRLSDSLHGSPLIHEVSALERALQLGRDRLEFSSERLADVGLSIFRRG